MFKKSKAKRASLSVLARWSASLSQTLIYFFMPLGNKLIYFMFLAANL